MRCLSHENWCVLNLQLSGSLEENKEKPGDSEEDEDTQAGSSRGDDSQPQKEEMHDRDVKMMGAREAMQVKLLKLYQGARGSLKSLKKSYFGFWVFKASKRS